MDTFKYKKKRHGLINRTVAGSLYSWICIDQSTIKSK